MSISQELNRAEQYTEKEIYNKIDTIMKKEKSMYVNYQQKGETGKEYSQGDADLDMEAAEAAWPNFKTSLSDSKIIQHWALDQWRTQQ